jgi:hypothetical protein
MSMLENVDQVVGTFEKAYIWEVGRFEDDAATYGQGWKF